MSNSNSYRQILRSSSIMGSAQAISYLVGLVRVKIVAMILVPAGTWRWQVGNPGGYA